MDLTAVLVLIGSLFVFGWMFYMLFRSSHKEKEAIQPVAQGLGFSPLETDENLTEKIVSLYPRKSSKKSCELWDVWRRVIPEGEMFLFDLVDTSGGEATWIKHKAVAVISPALNLPPFTMFPRANQKHAPGCLANQILEWVMSRDGEPVAFPQFPALTERYVITSPDPDEMRRFMDEPLARFFSQTEMYTLHAAGDMFTFAELDHNFKTPDLQSIARRVNRAFGNFTGVTQIKKSEAHSYLCHCIGEKNDHKT